MKGYITGFSSDTYLIQITTNDGRSYDFSKKDILPKDVFIQVGSLIDFKINENNLVEILPLDGIISQKKRKRDLDKNYGLREEMNEQKEIIKREILEPKIETLSLNKEIVEQPTELLYLEEEILDLAQEKISPVIKGRVLGYDENLDQGFITGDDKNRYTFSITDWKELNKNIEKGLQVEFEVEQNQARNIFILINAHSVELGIVKNNVSQIKEEEILDLAEEILKYQEPISSVIKGRVLGYDGNLDQGFITGDDKNRYTFSITDWKELNKNIEKGLQVEFEVEQNQARNIFTLTNSYSVELGIVKSNVEQKKEFEYQELSFPNTTQGQAEKIEKIKNLILYHRWEIVSEKIVTNQINQEPMNATTKIVLLLLGLFVCWPLLCFICYDSPTHQQMIVVTLKRKL